MATIRIQTTQNVTVEYEIAAVGERMLATLIDWAVYVAYAGVVSFGLTQSGLHLGTFGAFGLYLPVLFYPLLCEVVFDGRTLGKHARHLRVVKRNGAAPALADYLLRWLLIPVDLTPAGGIGILTMLLSAHTQRLGDLTAGTVVVKLGARAGLLRESTFTATTPAAAAGYEVTFPQAAHLSDRDATLLRQLLTQGLRRADERLLALTAARVRELLALPGASAGTGAGTQSPLAFLHTVLRDHAHLAAQQEKGQ